MRKIAVCIKQVPNSKAKINYDTGIIERETSGKCMNIYDLPAIEIALQIKEKIGAEVYAFTMGPDSAEDILREAYALGVDSGVLISDKAFSGSDVSSTSYIISETIKYIGEFDIIICGKQTTDGDTGQIGGAIAKQLDILYSHWVTKVETIESDSIVVHNRLDEKVIVSKNTLPLVLSIEPCACTVRIPSLTNKLKSRKKEIIKISNRDLKLNESRIGVKGSNTKVIKIKKNTVKKDNRVLYISSGEALDLIMREINKIH